MIRKFLTLTLLLFCTTLANAQVMVGGDSVVIDYGNPKTYEVGNVVITGVQYLDQSVLLNIAGINTGDTIEVPGDKISSAIHNLWKQGLFSDVKIIATKKLGKLIWFEIQLQEKPRLSYTKYGKQVSKSDQEKILEKLNLNGKVVTENMISSAKNVIRNHYVEKGFMNTEVNISVHKDTAAVNKEWLYIDVDKKERVKVHRIYFEGNSFFSDKKLKRTMKDTKEKIWWKIFTSSKFIDEKYQSDKTKIVARYNDKGYRDAKIISDTVYPISKKRIDIRITIDEGHQYYFRNITWLGNTKHSSLELSAILGIKKGDVYDQSVLDQRLFMNQNGRDVSSLYMDDGYLFFSVTPVEVNVVGDSVDLEMRIYEGKQARINKVTVSGNVKTNDRVIMREIRTLPGQLFSRADIIRTQRELAQLGYFDQEKLGVNPVPNPVDGTVDIEYTVEERPSDQLELSGGYGANQLVGTLGLSFNNFSARNFFKKGAWRPLPSGDGQKLSLRAQTNGKYYQSYNASFTEPWLGGKKPNSFSTSVFYSKQTNGTRASDIGHEEIDIVGISVGLGWRLKKPDDWFSIYTEASYQYYTLENYGGTFLFSDGVSNNFSLQGTLSRNSINKPIYPTKGSQISLTLQATPPWSLTLRKDIDFTTASDAVKYKYIEYHKWKFSSNWFIPIDRKERLVLMSKIQFGFLGLYNRDLGPSPFERFYLGGDGLSGYALDGREIIALRGYPNNSITPLDENGRQIGGTIFDKYSFELRYPVSLNPSATIYFLTFAEAGNAWLKFSDFNPFSGKRSFGAGIRIFLPVFGLLGLDYGYGIDEIEIPRDGHGEFHFSIGQQF